MKTSAELLEAAYRPVAAWLQTAPRRAAALGDGWWYAGSGSNDPARNVLVITTGGEPGVRALIEGLEFVRGTERGSIVCIDVKEVDSMAGVVERLDLEPAGDLPHFLLTMDDLVLAGGEPVAEVERVSDEAGFADAMRALAEGFDFPYDDPGGEIQVGLLQDPRLTFRVARVEGEAASTVVTWRDGEDSYLLVMGTSKRFQKRGIARQLLERAMLEERDAGMRAIQLVASEAGAKLYAAAGFRLIARHPLWVFTAEL